MDAPSCGECCDTGTLDIFFEMDDEGRAIYLSVPCRCRDRAVPSLPFVLPDESEVPSADFADVPF